uniref:Uncharacterized protein n=1 Tax=Rhizophora mucronata TaxID=61149 RepID=A0A2P2IVR3_RHIMU
MLGFSVSIFLLLHDLCCLVFCFNCLLRVNDKCAYF